MQVGQLSSGVGQKVQPKLNKSETSNIPLAFENIIDGFYTLTLEKVWAELLLCENTDHIFFM